MVKWLILGLSFLSFAARGADKGIVNVFTWYDSIPSEVIKTFEQETGLKVNVDIYDANEVLEAKLLAGNSGYDVVFPTVWPFVARQIIARLYRPLEKDKLPNYKNLDPDLLKKMQTADPGNLHALPFSWGLVALGYDKEKVEAFVPLEKRESWALVYDKALVESLAPTGVALLDDAVDVFLSYALYRGYDFLKDPSHYLKTIETELKEIRPSIKRFATNLTPEQLANGELGVVMHWGEVLVKTQKKFQGLTGKPELKIFLPKEGTILWIDAVAIPADATHVESAHKFIDFLLRPEVAAAISNHLHTATAVKAAKPLINKEIRENKIIFPPKDYMKKVVMPEMTSPLLYRRLSRSFASILVQNK